MTATALALRWDTGEAEAFPTPPALRLVTDCGLDLAPDLARWFEPADEHDRVAVDGLDHPVLDVGCGPGRIVAHLTAAGVPALGVDVSVDALAHARALGAPVLHRSIFEPLPGHGRWGAALLLDGNIGIGGAPTELLGRLRELVRPGGLVVVEIGAPGSPTRRVRAHFVHPAGIDDLAADGSASTGDPRADTWFPWAVVGADRIVDLAGAAGLACVSIQTAGPRWFARLIRT